MDGDVHMTPEAPRQTTSTHEAAKAWAVSVGLQLHTLGRTGYGDARFLAADWTTEGGECGMVDSDSITLGLTHFHYGIADMTFLERCSVFVDRLYMMVHHAPRLT